ncbi:MAG: hypothetical protein V3V20_09030 [Algisphaera sp.]
MGPDNNPLPPDASGRDDPPASEKQSVFFDMDDIDALDEIIAPSAPQAARPPKMTLDATLQAAAEESLEVASERTDDGSDTDAVEPALPDATPDFTPELASDGIPVAALQDSVHSAAPPVESRDDSATQAIPWIISIGAHVALILLAFFVVWSVQTLTDDSKVVIPVVTLSDNPGAALETQTLERVDPTPLEVTVPPQEVPLPEPEDAELLLDAALPGLSDPLAAAPSFELAVSDVPATEVMFMGSGGNATKIVFVLEADGSIISDYPQIVGNLARTLRDMNEQQKYSVVVFDGQGVKEVPPAGLKVATAASKVATLKWLKNPSNVKNYGTGDPIAAIERAARLRPELIFLLSQNLYNPGGKKHEFQRAEIIEAVKNLPARNLVINTIEFNQVDPLKDVLGRSLMEEIASVTNGKYNFTYTNVDDAP